MLSAVQVANYFIKKGVEEFNPVTSMKLIKLCYIAQGVYLVTHNEKLFSDNFEAWRYGPVAPSLYQEFKRFGDQVVTIYGGAYLDTHGMIDYPHINEENSEFIEVLNMVWDKFRDWSAPELSAWTHRKESAWSKTEKNEVITDEMLKTEFQALISET